MRSGTKDARGTAALPGPLAGPASPVVARMGSDLGFALACVRLMLSGVPPLCAF